MALLALFQLGSSIFCLLLAISLVCSRAMNPLCARILGANFALFSVQYFFAFLIFHLDYHWAVYPRVALAMLVGPLLFAYFVSVLRPCWQQRSRILIECLAVPVMIALLVFDQWQVVDWLIIFSFFCYTVAAVLLRRYPVEALISASAKPQAWRWLNMLLAMMMINLLTELGVALEVRYGVLAGESILLLLGNSAFFLFNLLVLISVLTRSPMTEWMHQLKRLSVSSVRQSNLSLAELKALFDRWQVLMEERELFMAEHGITVSRASKLLGVPARHLSQAVNTVYGASYSQYLNDYRVERAKRLLRGDAEQSITMVFLEAGFSTKSHFHREFSRVVGMTPSEFRAQRDADTA